MSLGSGEGTAARYGNQVVAAASTPVCSQTQSLYMYIQCIDMYIHVQYVYINVRYIIFHVHVHVMYTVQAALVAQW